MVAADDVGEVGSALLFAGRDGVGDEARFGRGVDSGGLGPQGGDLAVGAADVRAGRMPAGVVRGAQCGECVVIAGQEGFRVLEDLEPGVVDECAQLAFAEVGAGVAVGELGGRGAVAVGGRAADLLVVGEAFAGLGEGLGQGPRPFSWSRTSSMLAFERSA
ncbi:hypothetical protein [Streptomyces sp. SID10815]|uniref:hypothetical protein n=1 Tax=Streptomyces sp. SID10815 TaxID=2706027 RepID=UPI0013C8581A|nr:hypothetical protein [Streptomyces sp. SID10815]NEA46390.1 hypothetical protein [Streptomyces sp. SID10815]